jgi:hypothetical protein
MADIWKYLSRHPSPPGEPPARTVVNLTGATLTFCRYLSDEGVYLVTGSLESSGPVPNVVIGAPVQSDDTADDDGMVAYFGYADDHICNTPQVSNMRAPQPGVTYIVPPDVLAALQGERSDVCAPCPLLKDINLVRGADVHGGYCPGVYYHTR